MIFGDVNPALLSTTALSNLSDFVVQKGGGLVMIAGPAYNPLAYRGTPLAPLVPIDLATARGSRSAPRDHRRLHDAPDHRRPERAEHATGRHAGRNGANLAEAAAALLAAGSASRRNRPKCWPSIRRAAAPTAARCR